MVSVGYGGGSDCASSLLVVLAHFIYSGCLYLAHAAPQYLSSL